MGDSREKHQQMDNNHVPPANPITYTRYTVLAWLCVMALLAYLPRNALGVAETRIRQELHLSDDATAWVLAAFFMGYTLFQLPGGWVADRWGTRRVLPVFVMAWSLASIATRWTPNFTVLLSLRVAMGIAQAGIFCCAANSFARWFPTSGRAGASGWLAGFMNIGGAVASMITGYLMAYKMGWRDVFVILGLPGILWSVAFYWWYRDTPSEHRQTGMDERALLANVCTPNSVNAPPWLFMLGSSTLWLLCLQQFFRAAANAFYSSQFGRCLREVHEIHDDALIGVMCGLPVWALALGNPAGGMLADWILRRTGSAWLSRSGLATIALVAATVLGIVSCLQHSVAWAVAAVTASSLAAALGGAGAYAVAIDRGGAYVGTVFSIMNMAGNLGAFLMPLAVARLASYSTTWNSGFWLYAAMHALAALCWFFLQPDGAIVEDRSAPPSHP